MFQLSVGFAKSDLSSTTKCDQIKSNESHLKLELSMSFCSTNWPQPVHRWVCRTSKCDLSSTTKCDQNHFCDNYEFGNI
jgi:hypothetical protein